MLTVPEKFRRAVLETIRQRHLLNGGESVLLAVSGGADSTALLRVMHSLIDKLTLRIVVAHIHHGLRGEEADRDADRVFHLAAGLGLVCHVEKIDLQAVANGTGNLEDNARHARYQRLAEIARTEGCSHAATGHTQSDQAETVLHRLIRSAGPCGLQGIRPSVDFYSVHWIRPLLDQSRAAICAYLSALQQEWCEDGTNRELTFSRNRIRHVILPELHAINSDVESALSRLAEISAADEAFFQAEVSRLQKEMMHQNGDFIEMDVHELRALPESLRWRMWRVVVERLESTAQRQPDTYPSLLVAFEQIKQLDRLVMSQEGRGEIQLRNGIVIERRHYRIRGRKRDR